MASGSRPPVVSRVNSYMADGIRTQIRGDKRCAYWFGNKSYGVLIGGRKKEQKEKGCAHKEKNMYFQMRGCAH